MIGDLNSSCVVILLKMNLPVDVFIYFFNSYSKYFIAPRRRAASVQCVLWLFFNMILFLQF